MDIYFSDETSIRLKGKKTALVIDPTSTVEADAILLTQKNLSYVKLDKVKNARVTIAGSGEYEIGGVAIVGVKVGETTTYYVKMDGVALVHLGGITAPLSDSEIDKYPSVDVLFVPVIKGIAEMVTKFEAKVVVPIKYENASLTEFFKEMGKDAVNTQPKLSISREKLPAELEIVALKG